MAMSELVPKWLSILQYWFHVGEYWHAMGSIDVGFKSVPYG